MNRPITGKEIELLNLKFPQRKAQFQMATMGNSTKNIKKN